MVETVTRPASDGGQLQPVPAALPVPDDELVRRAQAGKTEAFEELVRRHERKVYNIAYRMLGNPEDASEALQDTFLRAYRFLHRFQFKAQFFTWLYRIATNVSLTKLRRRKSPVVMSLDQPVGDSGDMVFEIPDDQFSPDLLFKRRELQRKLQQAVDELPEDYRTVVVLRDLEGLSNEEVSKVLNLTVAAVKSRLHRGRLALRSKLESHL
ncbi:MAG TPA: sigma-70 family RNA polymerase sigma factor [candidate division WOR-3 bacterium]|uniref:Sigma-70 family RNA polymerase sigma factor n=1 Tax=candidate division WOR-3 bacterium TaxID=2052148 RepID=A0A7V0XEJ6_UNCW3|nr:sigma-70 family RNA polymerase sigma factor [candidate division WOR-3 bacterium]